MRTAANAHEETLVLVPADAPAGADPVAIVPLMHRHEVEPERRAAPHQDAPRRRRPSSRRSRRPRPRSSSAPRTTPTTRRSWPRPRTCRRSPTRSPDYLAEPADRRPWDVVDLRRLRCGDPAADALAAAFGAREMAEGWTLNVEREDVCPVVTFPVGADMEDLPLDARQEGAPRDPAQGPSRRGRRRDPSRRLARPAGRPRGLHRAAPEEVGAPTASSPTRPAAPRAGSCSSACSSSTAPTARSGCRSCRSAAGASRPASTSRPTRATSTTTPASTPTPSTCRRASSSSTA